MYSIHCTHRNTTARDTTYSRVWYAITEHFIVVVCTTAMETTPDDRSRDVLSSVSVLEYNRWVSTEMPRLCIPSILAQTPVVEVVFHP